MTPPRIASWLITLFVPPSDAEEIHGDLLEEFSGVASQAGGAAARRWYWRQTIKTITAVLFDSFRAAQWLFAVVTIWFLSGYIQWGYRRMVVAFLARYHVYTYVDPYAFWLFYEIAIGCLIIPMLLGSLLALMARKREMVAAFTLGLWNGVWYGAHGWWLLTHLYRWNDYRFPRPIASVMLASMFLSPFMIAAGARITVQFVSRISWRRA
ncbi:MAG TPA: permease prefix domain 2-containing transporter [Bryobacteraceae bacterium]|jgi:hypothetical protein